MKLENRVTTKIKITRRKGGGYHVYWDGRDISDEIASIRIDYVGGEIPTVTIGIPVSEAEADLGDWLADMYEEGERGNIND